MNSVQPVLQFQSRDRLEIASVSGQEHSIMSDGNGCDLEIHGRRSNSTPSHVSKHACRIFVPRQDHPARVKLGRFHQSSVSSDLFGRRQLTSNLRQPPSHGLFQADDRRSSLNGLGPHSGDQSTPLDRIPCDRFKMVGIQNNHASQGSVCCWRYSLPKREASRARSSSLHMPIVLRQSFCTGRCLGRLFARFANPFSRLATRSSIVCAITPAD